jgi:diadenosine tetraphosphate (Ap4A) HIT family hydrolase
MCTRWEEDADLHIAEMEHSFAILNRDQFFTGYTLLFTREHVTELFHLEPAIRQGLMDEVTTVAAALDRVFRPAKMNYELLGNMVPHMHWHLVPRFREDSLWPRPIWSEPHKEKFLEPEEYQDRIRKIRDALNTGLQGRTASAQGACHAPLHK